MSDIKVNDGLTGQGADHVFNAVARLVRNPVMAAVASQPALRGIFNLESRLRVPQAKRAAGLPPIQRVIWLETGHAPEGGVLVYFHGGGFTIGSVVTHGSAAARLARQAGLACAFVV